MTEDEQNEIEELCQKNVDTINSLIEKYSDKRSEKIYKALSDNESYFTSPASAKEDYHDCHIGGLAKHCIDVFVNLVKLDKVFGKNFSKESLLIVALFHDFGKCKNSSGEDFYVPTEDSWKRKNGQLYDYDNGEVYLTTRDRTIFHLLKLDLDLTAEEFQAILLNDGQYIEENKGYKNKECDLALLLHMADRMTLSKINSQ